jgi:hypothetical protein
MAVTITTKFYEPVSVSWKDLSKIVFTSPNMTSPNTAGTRSHILPGQGALGLWYEDTSNMYRIADCQQPTVTSYTNCSGTLITGTCASGTTCFCMANSIRFQVTFGECYDCRLTAWDDATHTTTLNEVISGDYCRVSAVALYYTGADFKNPSVVTEVYPPVYNRILKGNVSYMGTDYFYGTFNLQYRTASNTYGDIVFFKPILYGLTPSISYGVHNFVIVLHYSYT